MGRWPVDRKSLLLLLTALGTFSILFVNEVVLSDEPFTPWEMVSETFDLVLLVGAAATTAALLSRVRIQEEQGVLLRREIEFIRSRGEEWSREMSGRLRELGAAIQTQFERWSLTPAEQEVGLLLLKGFSHKEIARLRQTSEATIRQQAAALYQKAGLSGRAALSAFFLEDLLLPDTPPVARRGANGSTIGWHDRAAF